MRKPTRQQCLFVDEYLRLRKSNATRAAINAGYSEKSASSQAYQLLQNPIVLQYLKKREDEIRQRLQEEFFFDAVEARNVLYSIMKNNGAKDSDRINAAKDFLDRAGFKSTDKLEVNGQLDTGAKKLDEILEQLK